MIKVLNSLTKRVHDKAALYGHWDYDRNLHAEYAMLFNKLATAQGSSTEELELKALSLVVLQILDYCGQRRYNFGKELMKQLANTRTKV